ncbi:MAG: gliding motility-associated ABC transporter ATP-binding subunit GldA [Bacteroidales bacterium]
MSIKVQDLSKQYAQQKALDNVNFEVNPGEIVGFVGPNGAGKTTAMKILTGYILPTSGNAWVLGKNVIEYAYEIRKNIGYLPEHNPLYPQMYVTEYLEYVAGLYKINKNRRKLIRDIISATGLGSEQKKQIGNLSKGYRQRVGLAQAIIHNPDVLILDEPTSGLDPNQIIEIRNLISELGQEKTVMLSTHLMQEVEAICDRILIINNGQIVADDKVGEVYSRLEENKQTIHVEFDKPVAIEMLKAIDGVNQLKKINNHNWLIEGISDTDIRQNIFQFAVKNDLTVLSMQKKGKSLEEVFHELTR